MQNPPMYTFIIERVSLNSEGHILGQDKIYAHDEDDALGRYVAMNPEAFKSGDVGVRIFPFIQTVEVASPSNVEHAKAKPKSKGQVWDNKTGGFIDVE